MTTARIASSSVYSPIWLASDVRMLDTAIRPAMPAQKPQNDVHEQLDHAAR